MKALPIRLLAVLCLLSLPWPARATEFRFEQGSLIIPMQKAYQTDCGAVAADGLVYRLLQNKVTVYWAVEPTKASHHRCKNTANTSNTNPPSAADKRLLDGCDMTVASEDSRPVSLLQNAAGTVSTADWKTFATSSPTANMSEGELTVNAARRYLRYMGGPFIIDASQAAKAITLLKSSPDFEVFRRPEPTTCVLGTHFNVRIHRANNAFKAPVARVMNETPPPIALVKGYNTSNWGSVEILRDYLKNAGLNFPGAEGTFASPGKIFDVLDQNTDLITTGSYPRGKLNWVDPTTGKLRYKVMWSPHWDGSTADQNKLKSALDNIAYFVEAGNSIFNECASIETYENSYKSVNGLLDVARKAYTVNQSTQFMTGGKTKSGLLTATTEDLYGDSNHSTSDFVPSGVDCSDKTSSTDKTDCYAYTNYANLFSQKGDYTLFLTPGTVEGFKPRAGQDYNEGTVRMLSTYSNTTSKNGWDLFISRQKDNNKQYGNVIYLAGHSFVNSAAGNRIVLNTLLNLAYKPQSLEASRSEPVADITYKADGTVDQMRVLSGTFLDLPPQPLNAERINFEAYKAANKAGDWVFPYIEGRFRAIPVDKIGINRQDFSQGEDWEASLRMPTPDKRTLFTVLGSNQKGLQKLPFTLQQLTTGCMDTDDTGKIKTVCDLQEAMGLDRTSAGLAELDSDGDGKVDTSVTADARYYNNHMAQHFVQRVRGFCVAHERKESMTPVKSDCDSQQFGEVRATLGGLDHASPAVVGKSMYVKTPRAEVAYIGGMDGQLHAIYLRGPTTGLSPAPVQGQELWAFLPKGQLGRLATNDARVDVSPVVSDVFVDYEDRNNNGVLEPTERSTGKFVWRTVLVSGSGRLGGEIFALDVTDPLKPIILWDITADSDGDDSEDPSENVVPRWRDFAVSINPPPKYNDPSTPSVKSGPYNFAQLGDSLSMNLVPVRRGNRPAFQVVVSTNGRDEGSRNLEVFSLDVGTGKKLWQWERYYKPTTSNSVPGGTSTLDVDGDGSMDRVYVGDMEGKVWELSLLTGANMNYFDSVSGNPGSYPLFDTKDALQPISTVPAILRLPYKLSGRYANIIPAASGRLALAFGTGGTDWVLASNPLTKGRIYFVASHQEDTQVRERPTFDKSKVDSALKSLLVDHGTTKPVAATYTELLAGERAVGSPKIVGGKIVLTTAYGTTDANLFSDLRGNTRVMDMSVASDPEPEESGKAAAGVLVMPDGTIITQSLVGIQKSKQTTPPPPAGLPGKRTPVRVGSWLDQGRTQAE